jgi:HTH-type transcriptional regulator/antitoxin HigA
MIGKMTLGTPNSKTYIELLTFFPPRPIDSEEELLATQKVIDSLIDQGKLTLDEQDYLNVLGTLVHEYEEKHHDTYDIYGVELLQALITEFGLQQKDLMHIFKTDSVLSEVLNGQSNLTVNHIYQLSKLFQISPSAFFEA